MFDGIPESRDFHEDGQMIGIHPITMANSAMGA